MRRLGFLAFILGALLAAPAFSQNSFEAVLAKQGIDAKRLALRGLGPLAPVASNRTENGQAKNRRVELVEQ